MLTKDSAICIRVVDYSETSQIATFFTRQTGKIQVIAKGSKRPKSAFAGPLEIFSFGKIVFTHSPTAKLATLTEFDRQTDFSDLSKNLYLLNCTLFASELLNTLTDACDPHPQLFDKFSQFLTNSQQILDMDKPAQNALRFLILFQLTLLPQIGLKPILNSCANCKNTYDSSAANQSWKQVFFSSSANGLICRDCQDCFADRMAIKKSVANCLSDLKLLADADRNLLNQIEKLLIYHFTEITHRPPKMAKYILKEMKI